MPYFYQVKIYQHWNTLIHDSGILNASSYVVPIGILKPGEIYGYRIYTFDKDIRTYDVDNISINQIFFLILLLFSKRQVEVRSKAITLDSF